MALVNLHGYLTACVYTTQPRKWVFGKSPTKQLPSKRMQLLSQGTSQRGKKTTLRVMSFHETILGDQKRILSLSQCGCFLQPPLISSSMQLDKASGFNTNRPSHTDFFLEAAKNSGLKCNGIRLNYQIRVCVVDHCTSMGLSPPGMDPKHCGTEAIDGKFHCHQWPYCFTVP